MNLSDYEFEQEARKRGWKPTVMGNPAPSPLITLSWMRWAYDLGRIHGMIAERTATIAEELRRIVLD